MPAWTPLNPPLVRGEESGTTFVETALEQALSNRGVPSLVSSVSSSIPIATFGLIMLKNVFGNRVAPPPSQHPLIQDPVSECRLPASEPRASARADPKLREDAGKPDATNRHYQTALGMTRGERGGRSLHKNRLRSRAFTVSVFRNRGLPQGGFAAPARRIGSSPGVAAVQGVPSPSMLTASAGRSTRHAIQKQSPGPGYKAALRPSWKESAVRNRPRWPCGDPWLARESDSWRSARYARSPSRPESRRGTTPTRGRDRASGGHTRRRL